MLRKPMAQFSCKENELSIKNTEVGQFGYVPSCRRRGTNHFSPTKADKSWQYSWRVH